MKIIVNGLETVIKSGSSFDYISENRLFLGRDSYSLTITFPLVDCPENIAVFGHLYRKDCNKDTELLDCIIMDDRNSFSGALLVVSISETEVKCQFVEGKCESVAYNSLNETFVDALDLGSPSIRLASQIAPADAWNPSRGEVALPWVNNDYPDVPNNWVDRKGPNYTWDAEVTRLSWQPYLLVIVKRIISAIGYSCDLSAWEKSPLKYLLICNTMPASWTRYDYASCLPHWSVSEFFEKLEMFLGVEFDMDHRRKTISFSFTKDKLQQVKPISLTTVVDSFSIAVANGENGSGCEYIGTKRIAYKDNQNPLWKYLSCDWYFKKFPHFKIIEYDTLQNLIDRNGRQDSYDENNNHIIKYGDIVFVGSDYPTRPGLPAGYDTTIGRILYAKDVDTHFVHRAVGTVNVKHRKGKDAFGNELIKDVFYTLYVLQPVNIFGSGIPESEDVDTEELEFVPAWIQSTYISESDDRGPMLFLAPGEMPNHNGVSDTDDGIKQPGAAYYIESGESESNSGGLYDVVYIGYWDGVNRSGGLSPCPQTDSFSVYDDWRIVNGENFDLRINGTRSVCVQNDIPVVDPKKKYSISWLGDSVPDPRAIFHIEGRRYVCEKITATFTEYGMSQLLKGEFYPIADD